MTRFTSFSARARASKYAVFFLVLGTSFFWSPIASANGIWQATNGLVSGNTVQFDYRGGSATYLSNVTNGSTVTVTINNTIANCIGTCNPIPDVWTISINGQSYSGNTIEIRTITAEVSGQLTIAATGRDVGFWGGWYGPIITISISSPVIPVVSDSQTVVNNPSNESQTPVIDTVNSDTQTLTFDSPTVVVSDTSVVIVETPTVLETVTSESSTQTNQTETQTVLVTPSEPTPSQPEPSLPTPPPAVEPEPTPAPVQQPVVQPEPQPVPEFPVEPEPPLIEEVLEEVPVQEEIPLVEEPEVVEEPQPVEEPTELPVEEVEPDIPVEPILEEQPEQEPEPLPEPVVEPVPASQPDISPEPPSVSSVDLKSLAPETPVTLDNGVVVTAEVAIAVALLQDPGELLQELFTDPGAALAALGSVGADLPPEVRETAEEVVVSAIIAGGIATQAAASAAAVSAYRRKP